MQQHYILLGQMVSFLMLATPSVLALVLGIEEVGKRFFGYQSEPPSPERDEQGEWSGIFDDPEENQRRRLQGLSPRSRRPE